MLNTGNDKSHKECLEELPTMDCPLSPGEKTEIPYQNSPCLYAVYFCPFCVVVVISFLILYAKHHKTLIK